MAREFTGDTAYYMNTLRQLDLVPSDQKSVFLVGSTARGWQHETSDLDLIVITADEFVDERLTVTRTPLDPGYIPVAQFVQDGRGWEVKYWLDKQVDQLLDKISEEAFDSNRYVGDLTIGEKLFLARLRTCVPISGEPWIRGRLDELADSAFRAFMITMALADSDKAAEAAVGQLAAGNYPDAVLLARTAFDCAAEALMASHNEFEAGPKWRARRFKETNPPVLSFDEYWSIQTMRTYDPSNPGGWVEHVVETCKSISMEIEI